MVILPLEGGSKWKQGILLYALGVWFILVIVAILNGTCRNTFISPKVGEYAGHVISTIIFICVILLATYLFLSMIRIDYTVIDLLLVGTLWLVLTVLFEFVFGHYFVGHSWDKLLADCNILQGRVWVLVLLTEFMAPLLFGLMLRR